MDGASSNPGIIPRAVEHLFNLICSASSLGWTYVVKASFVEIYNETLYDLLCKETKDIEIRMADSKIITDVYLSKVTECEANSAESLYEVMKTARYNRATASTVANKQSSRSHAVTRLEVTGENIETQEKLVSFINLIDFAGSENPKTSEVSRDEEHQLFALSAGQCHQSFTHLLMPSLEGNSKTVMFVNVSPLQANLNETRCL
jgi:kinesin family protein C1